MAQFRRIASCFFVTLTILSSALWVRSWFTRDLIARLTSHSQVTAESIRGIVRGEAYFGQKRFNTYTTTVYQSRSRPAGRWSLQYDHGFLGFFWKHNEWKTQHLIEYRFPLWPIMLATATAVYLTKPKPKLRFGLFDLSLLITMLAIAIGFSVSFVNSRGLFF